MSEKRSHQGQDDILSTKRQKLSTHLILKPANCSLSIPNPPQPEDVTADMVYSIMEEVPDNSYDMAEVKTQSSTVIVSIANNLKEERGIKRKSKPSSLEGELSALKKGHMVLADSHLTLTNQVNTLTDSTSTLVNLNKIIIKEFLEQEKSQIESLEHQIIDEEHISQFKTVNNILRVCSDIILNSAPSQKERKARGAEVLTDVDIAQLKRKLRYPKVQHIIRWSPTGNVNTKLKRKALSCLTVTQRNVVQSVLAADLWDISKKKRNALQHRQASKTFAKEFLCKVFEDEKVKMTFTRWNVEIDDLLTFIDSAGPKYYQTSYRDVVYSLEQELRRCRERIAKLTQSLMDLDQLN